MYYKCSNRFLIVFNLRFETNFLFSRQKKKSALTWNFMKKNQNGLFKVKFYLIYIYK